MTSFSTYSKLISTNGSVSLMQTTNPDLPTFGVFAADGELLDAFHDRAEADEFADIARDRMRAGLLWPDPDAPACSGIHPLVKMKYAVAHNATTDKADLEFDGNAIFFN